MIKQIYLDCRVCGKIDAQHFYGEELGISASSLLVRCAICQQLWLFVPDQDQKEIFGLGESTYQRRYREHIERNPDQAAPIYHQQRNQSNDGKLLEVWGSIFNEIARDERIDNLVKSLR